MREPCCTPQNCRAWAKLGEYPIAEEEEGDMANGEPAPPNIAIGEGRRTLAAGERLRLRLRPGLGLRAGLLPP